MSKGKISRLVASVTDRWRGYIPDRLFHLKDDILSAEAVGYPAFTSDEFRVQHRLLADYWNEIAPKHSIRLKMEGDWPIEPFQWHKQENEFWDAFRRLGVEDILNHWAAVETGERKWPGDLFQQPPARSPETERQFLAHYLAGFVRYWAIEFPALARLGIEADEQERPGTGENGRHSRFHWAAAKFWESYRHTKRGQQWLAAAYQRDKHVPAEKRRHYQVVDIVAECLKYLPRGETSGRNDVHPPASEPLQRINSAARFHLKRDAAVRFYDDNK